MSCMIDVNAGVTRTSSSRSSSFSSSRSSFSSSSSSYKSSSSPSRSSFSSSSSSVSRGGFGSKPSSSYSSSSQSKPSSSTVSRGGFGSRTSTTTTSKSSPTSSYTSTSKPSTYTSTQRTSSYTSTSRPSTYTSSSRPSAYTSTTKSYQSRSSVVRSHRPSVRLTRYHYRAPRTYHRYYHYNNHYVPIAYLATAAYLSYYHTRPYMVNSTYLFDDMNYQKDYILNELIRSNNHNQLYSIPLDRRFGREYYYSFIYNMNDILQNNGYTLISTKPFDFGRTTYGAFVFQNYMNGRQVNVDVTPNNIYIKKYR